MRLDLVRLLLLLDLCSWAQTLPSIPANIKAPTGETLARQVPATGDQIYACDGTSWALLRPEARLLDESGKQLGSHFSGPTWEWSDGSRVIGRLVANATPDPDSTRLEANAAERRDCNPNRIRV
jgi:hypothetical protein